MTPADKARALLADPILLGAAMGCVVALQGFVLPGCLVVAACAAGVTANARLLRR